MDITTAPPSRDLYKSAADRVAHRIREKRLELAKLFDEQALITKLWWDWEHREGK